MYIKVKSKKLTFNKPLKLIFYPLVKVTNNLLLKICYENVIDLVFVSTFFKELNKEVYIVYIFYHNINYIIYQQGVKIFNTF